MPRIARHAAFSLLLAWAAAFAPLPAQGAQAFLNNIVLTNADSQLLIYFTIEGAFPSRMDEAVMSGSAVTFDIYVSLYRNRALWMDKKIADRTVTHTLRYDVKKKLFIVVRSESPSAPVVTHSFEEAKKSMAEVSSLAVCPLSRLHKGSPYEVKAKAVLERVEPPLHLRAILYFVSLWDFETDWYTISFNY